MGGSITPVTSIPQMQHPRGEDFPTNFLKTDLSRGRRLGISMEPDTSIEKPGNRRDAVQISFRSHLHKKQLMFIVRGGNLIENVL